MLDDFFTCVAFTISNKTVLTTGQKYATIPWKRFVPTLSCIG